MKICKEFPRKECVVYAISISYDSRRVGKMDTLFYIREDGFFGLGTANIIDVQITDPSMDGFNLYAEKNDRSCLMIHKSIADIDNLSRIINLDTDAIAQFENSVEAQSSTSSERAP